MFGGKRKIVFLSGLYLNSTGKCNYHVKTKWWVRDSCALYYQQKCNNPLAKLQNTPQHICISLNKYKLYCFPTHHSKLECCLGETIVVRCCVVLCNCSYVLLHQKYQITESQKSKTTLPMYKLDLVKHWKYFLINCHQRPQAGPGSHLEATAQLRMQLGNCLKEKLRED